MRSLCVVGLVLAGGCGLVKESGDSSSSSQSAKEGTSSLKYLEGTDGLRPGEIKGCSLNYVSQKGAFDKGRYSQQCQKLYFDLSHAITRETNGREKFNYRNFCNQLQSYKNVLDNENRAKKESWMEAFDSQKGLKGLSCPEFYNESSDPNQKYEISKFDATSTQNLE